MWRALLRSAVGPGHAPGMYSIANRTFVASRRAAAKKTTEGASSAETKSDDVEKAEKQESASAESKKDASATNNTTPAKKTATADVGSSREEVTPSGNAKSDGAAQKRAAKTQGKVNTSAKAAGAPAETKTERVDESASDTPKVQQAEAETATPEKKTHPEVEKAEAKSEELGAIPEESDQRLQEAKGKQPALTAKEIQEMHSDEFVMAPLLRRKMKRLVFEGSDVFLAIEHVSEFVSEEDIVHHIRPSTPLTGPEFCFRSISPSPDFTTTWFLKFKYHSSAEHAYTRFRTSSFAYQRCFARKSSGDEFRKERMQICHLSPDEMGRSVLLTGLKTVPSTELLLDFLDEFEPTTVRVAPMRAALRHDGFALAVFNDRDIARLAARELDGQYISRQAVSARVT